MGLSLTVLGCGGTYAGPDNACSGYLLRTATTTVLVDLGSGSLANAQRHIDLTAVDAFVLTHEHPDHWLDLPVARNVYRYVLDRTGVPVFTTAGTRALAVPFCRDTTFAWTTIADGDRATIGDIAFGFSRTDHPVETLAVLAEADGASVVYSSDTGPGWSPLAFGIRPDLALLEATFGGGHSLPVHLTAAEAGERAAAVGARQLVLTHLLPGTDPARQKAEAEEAYAGPVTVAEPGIAFAVEAERR
ncbi:MAG: MBL fold metallo-hydrolase [Acidimicrobiales bacterium]